jgi:hypothetical protein
MFKRNKTAVLVKDMFQEIEVRKPIEDIYRIFDIEEHNQLQRLMVVIIIVIMLKEVGVVETTNSWHNRSRRLLVR